MNSKNWNEVILSLSNPHVLQTSQWADVKSQFGWQPHYLVWQQGSDCLELVYSSNGEFGDITPQAAAMLLERRVLPGLSVIYVPKGPVLKDWEDHQLAEKVFEDLEEIAREFNVIQIKIDPDLPLGWGVPGEETERPNPGGITLNNTLRDRGWRFSSEQVQFRNTVLIDLEPSEEDILGKMKSKTRYNIRLAGRKGISVRPGIEADLNRLFRMYVDTSLRGGFTIRGEEYYLTLWNKFLEDYLMGSQNPQIQPLVAEFEHQPVAGAVIFKFGDRAWYLHGMSSIDHSEKMAPHLIQWEAIRWAKAQGCKVYDMWGAPDEFNEDDPLWGVYRFKRGYAGRVFRGIGAWDFTSKPAFYFLYTQLLPRILAVMRWIGNRQTKSLTSKDE